MKLVMINGYLVWRIEAHTYEEDPKKTPSNSPSLLETLKVAVDVDQVTFSLLETDTFR